MRSSIAVYICIFALSTSALGKESEPRSPKPTQAPIAKSAREKLIVLLKTSSVTKPGKTSETILKLRYQCEPLRYSAWVVNKNGVSAGTAEVQINLGSVTTYLADKKGARVLALEDSQGESERSFFSRLKGAELLTIKFRDSKGQLVQSGFITSKLYEQVVNAEKLCDSVAD